MITPIKIICKIDNAKLVGDQHEINLTGYGAVSTNGGPAKPVKAHFSLYVPRGESDQYTLGQQYLLTFETKLVE